LQKTHVVDDALPGVDATHEIRERGIVYFESVNGIFFLIMPAPDVVLGQASVDDPDPLVCHIDSTALVYSFGKPRAECQTRAIWQSFRS
jgi:hypothetical protein